MRDALVNHAARMLAEGGPGALTLRSLTREVGTSTMAVYTYFGSMEELRAAVAREGFDRLRQRLVNVADSPGEDPVVDLILLGDAYVANAVEEPHLYQVIFGVGAAGPGAAEVAGVGYDTFLILVEAVQRCVDSGRFGPADPSFLATQMWAHMHGTIALAHSGLIALDQVQPIVNAAASNLFVGFGDRADRVQESLAEAERIRVDRRADP